MFIYNLSTQKSDYYRRVFKESTRIVVWIGERRHVSLYNKEKIPTISKYMLNPLYGFRVKTLK